MSGAFPLHVFSCVCYKCSPEYLISETIVCLSLPYTQARLLIQRDSGPSKRDTLPTPNLPSLSGSFDASTARAVDVGSKATLMQIDIERQNLVLLPPLPAVSSDGKWCLFSRNLNCLPKAMRISTLDLTFLFL
jgi:hypothetical protein